jgi:hypothetical protein
MRVRVREIDVLWVWMFSWRAWACDVRDVMSVVSAAPFADISVERMRPVSWICLEIAMAMTGIFA